MIHRSRRSGLRPGDNLGRFTLLEPIGAGGHGWVWRAFDPRLARQVALKFDHYVDPHEHGAVLDEARALAQLHHPNIVPVYESGEVDDERPGHGPWVYVVMPLVDGLDLVSWLKAHRSSSPSRHRADVRRILLHAGRGLMAAHTAGWIHGDVKPSNILVGADDRVYIADFGLARRARGDTSPFEPTPRGETEASGTPAYLAPERHDGAPASVGSDVYAFCLTAWEVLGGAYPWKAQGDALVESKRRASLPSLAGRADKALERKLRQALSASPAERPTSLAPILESLEERRPRYAVAASSSITVVLVGVAASWSHSPDRGCADDSPLHRIWSADERARARDRLLQVSPEAGAAAWSGIEEELGGYASAWEQAYARACAALADPERPTARARARLACLEAGAAQLETLVTALHRATPRSLEGARDAIGRLGDPNTCGSDSSGVELAFVPVAILAELGENELARDTLERLPTSVSKEHELWSRYWDARLLERSGDPKLALDVLQALHWDAERVGQDTVAARAAVYAGYVLASVLRRPDRVEEWLPHARAAVERSRESELRSDLLEQEGSMWLYRARPESALEHYRAALELAEAREDDRAILSALGNVGVALEDAGRYDEALESHRRALHLARSMYGDWHPHVGRSYDNLGTTALRQGEFDEAIEQLTRGLNIRTAVYGPRHRLVGLSLHHRGVARLLDHRLSDALEDLARAQEIYAAVFEPDDLSLLQLHEAMAHAAHELGQRERAETHAKIALAGLSDRFSPDHPEIVGLREIVSSEPGDGPKRDHPSR